MPNEKEIITHPTGWFTVALWCDGHPVILCGLEELPRIGYRFEGNEGEWWEVVEDREPYICERVANQSH